MKNKLFIIGLLLLIFTGCDTLSNDSSKKVNMLGIEVCNINEYYETIDWEKVLRLYTYVGEYVTCKYQFYPNTSYNCEDFSITFSDDTVFELVSKSVENKEFTVKAVKVGNSNIQMIPKSHNELKQTTLNIEVR